MKSNRFLSLCESAYRREAIKKLVFSRPREGEISRVSGRLCRVKRGVVLALEYTLPGDTVSQRNLFGDEVRLELTRLISIFSQANLITTLGDAEYKVSKKGAEALIGGDTLGRRLSGDAPLFESAISELDKKKNYILRGDEPFLKKLGISSEDGRVHDKKQGKYRQINRFLEHIEDIYAKLPSQGELRVFDLCCGKSYLSFAVYYYLTEIKKRQVYMYGADLKRDVIIWCDGVARELSYDGMHFEVGDIKELTYGERADMVISLHACDVATDIVLETAIKLGAEVILSTPCCHRYMRDKITSSELSFVSEHPHLLNKLSEVMTDAIRVLRLEGAGYSTSALELTDPDDTPKNTLIRAVKTRSQDSKASLLARERYASVLEYLLGQNSEGYLDGIIK